MPATSQSPQGCRCGHLHIGGLLFPAGFSGNLIGGAGSGGLVIVTGASVASDSDNSLPPAGALVVGMAIFFIGAFAVVVAAGSGGRFQRIRDVPRLGKGADADRMTRTGWLLCGLALMVMGIGTAGVYFACFRRSTIERLFQISLLLWVAGIGSDAFRGWRKRGFPFVRRCRHCGRRLDFRLTGSHCTRCGRALDDCV